MILKFGQYNYYDCNLPSFQKLDLDIDMSDINNIIKWINSFGDMDIYQTTEKAFDKCIRVMPGVKHVVGNTDNRIQPYSQKEAIFITDETLIGPCNSIIKKLTDYYSSITGVEYRVSSLQIAGIKPGQSIHPHVDGFDIYRFLEKTHVPITTNKKCHNVDWLSGDLKKTHLEVGYAYSINNLIPHAANNNGENVRYHLIVDCIPILKYNELFKNGKKPYLELSGGVIDKTNNWRNWYFDKYCVNYHKWNTI